MPVKTSKKPTATEITAAQNFWNGCTLVREHPILQHLYSHCDIFRNENNLCARDGWAVVTSRGTIHPNAFRRAEPEEWAYVIAHCILHLGFGHLDEEKVRWHEWNVACDAVIYRFLADLKLGIPPSDFLPPAFSNRDETKLFYRFCENGIPENFVRIGTAGTSDDMVFQPYEGADLNYKPKWQGYFGEGLAEAVTDAVSGAIGKKVRYVDFNNLSTAQKAKQWFINSYPLLGSLAAAFNVIEDIRICQSLEVQIAAVNASRSEIYINPLAKLNEYECRFVMAHELLHVGLRHDARREGRDHYLWNVACDYVINQWLVEMGVGDMPQEGLLYDPSLKDMSAEAIYDVIVTDLRRFRKLETLRGHGLGDVMHDPKGGDWWNHGEGMSLDEFYRRCLAQGLSYQEINGRGFLPSGLIEEIWAMTQPPVPWDVELAHWFDQHFAPLEKRRSYARLNRKQSASPDIPRPSWVAQDLPEYSRTYGVVLDTSGSMPTNLLAKALGTIASYCVARDVEMVRVVFCDAAAYDAGYMSTEAIAEKVKVKGRGGTILQPGIDLLQDAEDFPKDGPILIITDGLCDNLVVRREHAFIVPEGHRLPFSPHGPVFYID